MAKQFKAPIASLTADQLKSELHYAREEIKRLNKVNGKAGKTIGELRNALDGLRYVREHFTSGDRARLYGQLRDSEVENRRLVNEIKRLKEKYAGITNFIADPNMETSEVPGPGWSGANLVVNPEFESHSSAPQGAQQ